MKKALLFGALFGISVLASSCLESVSSEDYCNNIDYCYQSYQMSSYELSIGSHYYVYRDYYECRSAISDIHDRYYECSYELNRYLDCFSRLSCSELKYDTSYCNYEKGLLSDCIFGY
ncbi:MAG: hypothetical protein IJU23_04745 [Proteobacteria bacterium]|nr:hypothetical protein [Pseudomonadota bacterium]